MRRARDRLWSALVVVLVVEIILVVASFGVCYVPESSTVEGIPPAASAQGVPEPRV